MARSCLKRSILAAVLGAVSFNDLGLPTRLLDEPLREREVLLPDSSKHIVSLTHVLDHELGHRVRIHAELLFHVVNYLLRFTV